MTSKNRVIVHLFYTTEKGAILKTVKSFLLFDVVYDDIPGTIDKIVTLFYSTSDYHEIKTITGVKDEIYVNGALI